MEPAIADVLIVGGGAAGGVAARKLTEAGLSVVCLEQGDWIAASEFVSNRPEYELAGGGRFDPNPNVRGRPEDYPCEVSESDLPALMYAGVGGTSLFYGGVWARALPSDFRARSLDGVADDWPLTYEELLREYEELDRELSVSGLGGNPAYPPGPGPPLPPHPINRTGRKLAEGMNALGWHWWPSSTAIASRPDGHLRQCVRYGVCHLGCPEGAKGSLDITHWRPAVQNGAKVVTGARVSEITLDSQGRASGAIYIDRAGREHLQRAGVVILAANGVGTPRLMLLSPSNRFPDGLANSSGLVGKRLMLHPVASAIGVYEDDLHDWVGPAGELIQSMEFYETDPSRGFVRGCKWGMFGSVGPLTTMWRWTTGSGAPDWGDSFLRTATASVGHLAAWHLLADDLPEESNAVTLDRELKDSDGLPAPKITYRISDNTSKMLDFNLARAIEAHEAAGAKSAWVSAGRGDASGHLLGTARMGDDPERSVVDRFGRCHDVPNLFVIDGSAFVTSLGVNPTATICALAKRTARQLIESHRDQVTA